MTVWHSNLSPSRKDIGGVVLSPTAVFDGTAYLDQLPMANATQGLRFTHSFWISKPNLVAFDSIMRTKINNNNNGWMRMNNDAIQIFRLNANTTSFNRRSSPFYDTANELFHVVQYYDSPQGNAADRSSVWINGVFIASVTTTNISQNAVWTIYTTTALWCRLGDGDTNGLATFKLSDFYAMEAIVPVTEFGRVSGSDWVPKEYTGSSANWGTAGYHLDFADPLDLGKDVGPNGNHFTNVNVTQEFRELRVPNAP